MGRWLCISLALLTMGCGGDPPPLQQVPGVGPDAGMVELDPAPSCPGGQSGEGHVWLGDPGVPQLVARRLHCLAGDGLLHGAFVDRIAPRGREPTQEASHRFRYPLDDPRRHEVQAYYEIVGMVAHYQPHLAFPTPAPVVVLLREQDSFATSRYESSELSLGLGDVRPAALPLPVVRHEYAHHLIKQHASKVPLLINESLADYLAAERGDDPSILALDRLALPAAMRENAEAMDLAARYLERSVANEMVYPDDVMTEGELCEVFERAAEVFPPEVGLVPEAKLTRCRELDDEQKKRPEPHLAGRVLSGALWDLRQRLGGERVNALIFGLLSRSAELDRFLSLRAFGAGLAAVDALLHAGADSATIREIFATRGLPLD